ncbi:putative leucine-rich repeat-containing, plant-type, leucine-rich repeat domain superfamily [Helianthus annuus]|nr:putative leucine-rich repeat-containing, plant-type, leucine-rich repeat domain superfamily [Helianthus annuus]
MITKICIYIMHPQVFFIFSLLLLDLLQTITTNQLVAMGRDNNGVVINKKCIDKDRRALLDLKTRLQDPKGVLSTWTTEEEADDCCKWNGVTCNGTTGHVTQLELSGLGGEIGPSLGDLAYLEQFALECPERCVIENIDWLANLSHLQTLSMEGIFIAKANHWVDVFQTLQKLSSLTLYKCDLSQVMYPAYSSSFDNSFSSSIQTLELSNNNLNSSMYHWLFPLTSNNLSTLDLSENMLDGIPKYFGNLCGLTSLRINNNSAPIKFPDFLRNLSGCTSDTLQLLQAIRSQLTGPISDEIQVYSSLKFLNLFNNRLNGAISDKLWELPMLETFVAFSNFLSGAISENIGKSKLWKLHLSNNSLNGVSDRSAYHMLNMSYVEYIDLSSCKLGPRFPRWIQKLKNLTRLDIANNGISDSVPLDFWNTWPSQLAYLNLSSNNITMEVPDLLSNFNGLSSAIDLSSNNLYGPIPNVSSTVMLLNLSRNKFSGGISFLCQIVGGYLYFHDLSNNFLTGQVPDCLWNFKSLDVLNLGHNNFFGRLPASIESLFNLEVLYLYKNKFTGELPLSLKNCTNLKFLNLGVNNFSGNVPAWIGENLSKLYVLSLSANNFFGTIPLQLCQLVNLQLLDLSKNNLFGTIPSCMSNLTTMVQEGLIPTRTEYVFSIPWYNPRYAHQDFIFHSYFDHATIEWQGNVREFSSILGLLRIIDLSSNNLTGQFPYELTNLHGLIALNLSKNALGGEIPWKIGDMKKLLTLDISRNNFSGGIPSSMAQMTSINYLDVSYNNLSGRIPSSTQLQSFEPSRYSGNAGLCGPPITKNCIGDDESEVPPTLGESEGGREDVDELQRWFYIGGGSGFVTGFWIVCGTLVLNRHLRHAFFHFLDRVKNVVYVKVMVFIAKLQRAAL